MVIEAMLWDEAALASETEMYFFVDHQMHWQVDEYKTEQGETAYHKTLMLKTLEGDMRVSMGDWIVKGIKGEVYPVKPDIFAATYEPVEE